MAWFILTSREFFPVLTPSRGFPAHFTNSSSSPPNFSRWSSATPIFQKLKEHSKGHMAGQVGTITWEFGSFQKLFHHDLLFLSPFKLLGLLNGHIYLQLNLLRWSELEGRDLFNLYRYLLESLLTGEEHRDNIEIRGRACNMNLYDKNRDLRNSTETPLSWKLILTFYKSKKVVLLNEGKCSISEPGITFKYKNLCQTE